MENKLTPEQALNNIGLALAHESLKLTQKEHLTLIESYNIVKLALAPKVEAKEPPITETNENKQ